MGPLDAVALIQELRNVFTAGTTKSPQWRIEQLNGFVRLATERQEELVEALKQDLNKPFVEAMGEINAIKGNATSAAKNVEEWMAPEKVTSAIPFPGEASIIPEPLGVALVISAWNYPILLSLDPVIGAIAAGNAVVLKPSELAPACSATLAKLLPLYLDPSAVQVIEGGIPETTALLEQRWDKIFYTGNTRVGKIIMAAAAKHLTPVTLELGGKSPTIVDSTADLDVVAKRVSWGKWSCNNGQTCISPDYILAEESITPTLIEKIRETLKDFYGEDPKHSQDLSRIINNNHMKRLNGLLNDEKTAEKVVIGGQQDAQSMFIQPTLIVDPPLDSPIMQEEIFGPLLVLITVKNVDEAIKIVNSRSKPLALYLFTEDKTVVKKVLQETSSGGVTINDTILHVRTPGLPFGGVGDSGMGSYHGKHSFDAFSHKKAVLYRDLAEDLMVVRYPPYSFKG